MALIGSEFDDGKADIPLTRMAQTPTNPNGVPIAVFDDIRAQTTANRAQYYYDFTMPIYGFNREGAEVKEGVRRNWGRRG